MRLLSLFPRSLKTPLLLIMLVTLVVALTSLVYYFRIQPVIPLFYTMIQAENQLVAKEWLFLFPIFSSIITMLHLTILAKLVDHEQVLVTLFTWSTFALQVLLLIAFFRILVIIS